VFIAGATFLVWFGPTVRLTVSDPDLIREIFTSKSELYEKVEAHPLVKQLEGDGLLSLKGEKWALHRKIITPTFHMENLKVSLKVIKLLGWMGSGAGRKQRESIRVYLNSFILISAVASTCGGKERKRYAGAMVGNDKF
jgi:cytochrome P450